LKQEFLEELDYKKTLYEELLSSCKEEYQLMQEIKKVEQEMQDHPERLSELIDQFQDLQKEGNYLQIDKLDSKIKRILNSMGFTMEDENKLVETFSGGWKMRIGLAKVLCADPNVLFLDEPTNHMGKICCWKLFSFGICCISCFDKANHLILFILFVYLLRFRIYSLCNFPLFLL
jgi:ATP-binding cassette subfamily F protein 3